MMKAAALIILTITASLVVIDGSSKGNNGKMIISDDDMKISFCEECENLAVVLKHIVDDPESVTILVDSLNLLCDTAFVPPFRGICHMIVNSAGFITQQVQGLLDDPEAFCQSLHFCSSSNKYSASKHLALSMASKLMAIVQQQQQQNNGRKMAAFFSDANSTTDHCGLCSHSLDEVKRTLQNTQLMETYENETLQMCSMAGKYALYCKDALEQYFHSGVAVILDMLCDTESICKDMKLCDDVEAAGANRKLDDKDQQQSSVAGLARKVVPMQMFLGMDVGCMACKGGLAMALRMINNEQSFLDLGHALSSVCSALPASFQAGCLDFMDMYSKSIIELGLSELSPAKVCSALGACSDSYFQQMELVPLTGKSFLTCTACKLLSKVVVHQLNQDDVQMGIVKAVVSHTCAYIPGSCGYKERCESVVSTYLPYAVEDMVALTYVPKMCTAADLC